LEPATPVDVLEAMAFQRVYGLLTNAALVLAIARRLNCTAIASADKTFDQVKGFVIYHPSEVGR
jgi:predicted nucleic acid-binding protein